LFGKDGKLIKANVIVIN